MTDHLPPLIFADIVMPKVDGISAFCAVEVITVDKSNKHLLGQLSHVEIADHGTLCSSRDIGNTHYHSLKMILSGCSL